jgi:urea transporter
VFGECHLVLNFVQSKPECSLWLPFKVVDAVLRGFSQVVFANNSIAGLAVVIGLALADVYVCAAGVLAATVATLTSLVTFDVIRSLN